jgi:hypothetical protein
VVPVVAVNQAVAVQEHLWLITFIKVQDHPLAVLEHQVQVEHQPQAVLRHLPLVKEAKASQQLELLVLWVVLELLQRQRARSLKAKIISSIHR